jgi:dipeptidyl aminopeptidase/acylaminoacyl peptidase
MWDLGTPAAAPESFTDSVSPARPVNGGYIGLDLVGPFAMSPDGRKLALASTTPISGIFHSTIRIWNLTDSSAEPLVLSVESDVAYALAFSPDGQTLASGWSRGGVVRLWRLNDPESDPLVLTGDDAWIYALAFSPDGQTLASGGSDGLTALWNLADVSADPVLLRGHEDIVHAIAFSPDGKTLATGSGDDSVRLWDLANVAAPAVVLNGHEDEVDAVVFSPDGHRLASGSQDGTVRLWIVSTEALNATVCEKVWRNLSMDEWRQFVGAEVPYEATCPNLPPGEGAPDAPSTTPAGTPSALAQHLGAISAPGLALRRLSYRRLRHKGPSRAHSAQRSRSSCPRAYLGIDCSVTTDQVH